METNGVNVQDALKGVLNTIQATNPQMVESAKVYQAWQMCSTAQQQTHVDAVYTVPDTNASKVVIYVDNGIWATELNLQTEMIKLRMNLALQEIAQEDGSYDPNQDQERIKNLRFAVSKEKYRGKRPCDIPVKEQLDENTGRVDCDPIPLTQEEERTLEDEVSCIENPAVRSAAFMAMKADRELKKGIEAQGRDSTCARNRQ